MRKVTLLPGMPSRRHGLRGRKGQGLIEYALIIILVAIACVGGINIFRNALAQNFNFVSSSISSSLSGGN